MIRAVVNVLTNEELALKLSQPSGIGQRPRPMCTSRGAHLILLTRLPDCLSAAAEAVILSGGSRSNSQDESEEDDVTAAADDRSPTTPKASRLRTSPRKRDPRV